MLEVFQLLSLGALRSFSCFLFFPLLLWLLLQCPGGHTFGCGPYTHWLLRGEELTLCGMGIILMVQRTPCDYVDWCWVLNLQPQSLYHLVRPPGPSKPFCVTEFLRTVATRKSCQDRASVHLDSKDTEILSNSGRGMTKKELS